MGKGVRREPTFALILYWSKKLNVFHGRPAEKTDERGGGEREPGCIWGTDDKRATICSQSWG